MPSFSKASMDKLQECHTDLQIIMLEAIKIINFSIICGFRSQDAQMHAYNTGKSKLKWPQSKHNSTPSRAVDIAPYFAKAPHIRWASTEEFIYCAGVIRAVAHQRNIRIRWGGDWDSDGEISDESWRDLGHFELI